MIVRPYSFPLEHLANQPKPRISPTLTQTNARLGSYLGFDAWNLTTSSGSTIRSALDFTMSIPISLGAGNYSSNSSSIEGSTTMEELFLPSVGAGAAVYGAGDVDGQTRGQYVAFLEREEENYPAQPWFFSNQPLDDSGWVGAHFESGGGDATMTSWAPTASAGKGEGRGRNGGERILLGSFGRLFLKGATLVLLHVLHFV
jgi:hypothetical protein